MSKESRSTRWPEIGDDWKRDRQSLNAQGVQAPFLTADGPHVQERTGEVVSDPRLDS